MRRLAIVIGALLLVGLVSAVPTTVAISAVGTNNITMNGNGATGNVSWFQWGMDVAGSSWAHTTNVTPSGGVFNFTLRGSPVYGCTTYYVRACDPTGCGLEVSATTPKVAALPVYTAGQSAVNIIESRFDLATTFWNSMTPYTAVTGASIFYAAILAMIFGGIFLRTRGTPMVTTLTILCGGLFASSAIALQLGLPPEFNALLQAVLYISLTCGILSWTVK